MDESVPAQPLIPRPLPTWAWVLSALLFPPGVFIAFGSARLLSWTRSIVLAIVSYVCVIGFARLMGHLEDSGAGTIARSVALIGGILMFWGWGFTLYRIGQNVSYWSPKVRRGWRRAAWFAVAVLCLSIAGIVLQLVLSYLEFS